MNLKFSKKFDKSYQKLSIKIQDKFKEYLKNNQFLSFWIKGKMAVSQKGLFKSSFSVFP